MSCCLAHTTAPLAGRFHHERLHLGEVRCIHEHMDTQGLWVSLRALSHSSLCVLRAFGQVSEKAAKRLIWNWSCEDWEEDSGPMTLCVWRWGGEGGQHLPKVPQSHQQKLLESGWYPPLMPPTS